MKILFILVLWASLVSSNGYACSWVFNWNPFKKPYLTEKVGKVLHYEVTTYSDHSPEPSDVLRYSTTLETKKHKVHGKTSVHVNKNVNSETGVTNTGYVAYEGDNLLLWNEAQQRWLESPNHRFPEPRDGLEGIFTLTSEGLSAELHWRWEFVGNYTHSDGRKFKNAYALLTLVTPQTTASRQIYVAGEGMVMQVYPEDGTFDANGFKSVTSRLF